MSELLKKVINHKLNRRSFLKWSAGLSGALAASGSLQNGLMTTSQAMAAGGETIVPGKWEVYIHYPDGMGRSKLKWPLSLRGGTMRNINTLSKLAGLAAEG